MIIKGLISGITVLSLTQAAVAQPMSKRQELLSERLELLKQQANIENEVSRIEGQLQTISCGPASATTVAVSSAVLYIVAFFKPSNFARANIPPSRFDLEQLEGRIPSSLKSNPKFMQEFNSVTSRVNELHAYEEKVFTRRLLVFGGLFAVSAAMSKFDISCDDAYELVSRLLDLRDDIGSEAEKIAARLK